MGELFRIENSSEDTIIQYDIVSCDSNVDSSIDALQNNIDEINSEIERYTNNADWLDNTVAVASGIICGMIDSIFVGEFSFDKANEWGNEKTNNFVVTVAKSQGYQGNDLEGAVKFLEDKYPIAADKVTNSFGGGKQHHLRDFSHHPTPVGLFFSLLTQFTSKAYGTDKAGMFLIVDIPKDGLALIGRNTPERLTFGVINWFFHMISDMAGSSSSIAMGKVGTGLPGPIGALLKEISVLPIFRNTNENGYKEFSVWVSKLFNGTLLGDHDENGKITRAVKFDLRTEVGAIQQLGKQAIPVLINECVVRGFYFIRRFANEIKQIHSFKELKSINWLNVVPAKNRTIIRMLTISSGTFMAVDLADATIRSAVSSGGAIPIFASQLFLRVNFVGLGRFAIAIGSDASMEHKKKNLEALKSNIKSQLIYYKDAKIYYAIDSSLKIASDAEQAINCLVDTLNKAENQYHKSIDEMNEDSKVILNTSKNFIENNKNIALDIIDILEV